MPDSTHAAIDSFFDFVDRGVDKLDRVLNRDKHLDAPSPRDKRPSKAASPRVIEAKTAPRPAKKAVKAIAAKPHFYIVESYVNGTMVYVVTDGGNARTECATRDVAEKVLHALGSVA